MTPLDTARMLMDDHRRHAPFRPFAADAGIADLAGAYAVQRDYVQLQMAGRGVTPVGYKVGLTSPRMQAMCKIDRPIAGVILEDRLHHSGVTLAAADFGRAGLEFELAVRLARDLSAEGGPLDLATVARAVDAVCPAVEVIDDRNCDYAALDVLSLVADNSWNAGVVLGEFCTPPAGLDNAQGVVSLDSMEADRGTGRDVLGHPYHSVAWVAQHLAETGQSLRAGAIVMTGNWVTTKFPDMSSTYRFEVQGLGAVELAMRM